LLHFVTEAYFSPTEVDYSDFDFEKNILQVKVQYIDSFWHEFTDGDVRSSMQRTGPVDHPDAQLHHVNVYTTCLKRRKVQRC
jgi:hypothetical protein